MNEVEQGAPRLDNIAHPALNAPLRVSQEELYQRVYANTRFASPEYQAALERLEKSDPAFVEKARQSEERITKSLVLCARLRPFPFEAPGFEPAPEDDLYRIAVDEDR